MAWVIAVYDMNAPGAMDYLMKKMAG